jgi:hypothetical protein
MTKFVLPALFGILMVAAGVRLFPRAAVWSDEAVYVASAYRTGAEGRLAAAMHLPEDILATGVNHKPVHMPLYVILLAVWVKLFPDPRHVILLNQALFALTVLLLWGFLTSFGFNRDLRSLLCLGVVSCVPLGFVYSNTAMMEALALFIGTLTIVTWYGGKDDRLRLYGLYVSGFLCLMTRETLVLLPLSMAAVHWKEIMGMHRKILGTSPVKWLLQILLVAALVWLSYLGFSHRGYFPNILSVLKNAAGWGERLAFICAKLRANLKAYFSMADFPHDILYGYTLLTIAATLIALVRGRKGAYFKFNLAIALFWAGSLIIALCLNDNGSWRSHRQLMVNSLLASVGFLLWLSEDGRLIRSRTTVIAVAAALSLFLMATEVRAFRNMRRVELTWTPDILTRLDLARPGDLVFERRGWIFLRENPRCQLMWNFSEDPAILTPLVEKARPRFVVLGSILDLSGLKYSLVWTDPETHVWINNRGGKNE